jgi:hypothetical protein
VCLAVTTCSLPNATVVVVLADDDVGRGQISCAEAGIQAPITISPDIVEIFRGEWEGQSANHLFVGETLVRAIFS